VKRSMRDYPNTSPSTRSMKSMSKREIQHMSPSTRNMLNASNLPYPEAAVPNRNVQIAQLNKHRSGRSTGSGSAMSGSGSAVSVASNKSGKFSIASDDSGNNRDVWLDVPNVS
jgi:4-diphosphocytidyl-2C-methyl-D-erythritol kinase